MSLGLPLRRSPDLPFAVRGAVAETSSELLDASLYWIWQQRPPSSLYLLDPMVTWRVATCSRPPVLAREVETETEAVEKSARVKDLEVGDDGGR
uniref:Uncharacterized protein n=1 Tax=Oryza glumipatula TaxID=40148 RepID=A0A0E0AFX2_9ORYZ